MSKYLRIVFQNLEPLRISDDGISQGGQTAALRYIPGSALRGVVVNALSHRPDFESMKKMLLSQEVRYLNAYPLDGERELIPSPLGFYENRVEREGKKELENVVISGSFTEGNKRAALGSFCRRDGDCIYYYTPDTGSDLKIRINPEEGGKQGVFRNEYLCAGYMFAGYIAVDAAALEEVIRDVFQKDMVLGNARSAGLGKCKILSCGYAERLPYQEYLPEAAQERECYMMLLSPTVMRGEAGELCGLDSGRLERELGVESLKISYCATATVDVKGYNRAWGGKIPSARMYAPGSVFHLEYRGTLTCGRMKRMCDRGIGIRRGEGFGRVLFLDRYPDIKYKEKGTLDRTITSGITGPQYEEDFDTLKVAARCYYRDQMERAMTVYVVEHPLERGTLANSRLGTVEAFAAAYRYVPREAERLIREHLAHGIEKEGRARVQTGRSSMRAFHNMVLRILDTDLETLLGVKTKRRDSVMGIPKSELITDDELLQMKLALLVKLIRYDRREEA